MEIMCKMNRVKNLNGFATEMRQPGLLWITLLLKFSEIFCFQVSGHFANLRALVWPIREDGQPEGERINYKIYISPNKFSTDKKGHLKMYVGQRPIRAMLGSQGGLGEFDTPISGKPDKLNIWVREEKTGTIQNFVIKNPNFFKNYAFDFRDGEVIEYERVIAVQERLQIKAIFLEAKKMFEKKIEIKYTKLRRKLFSELDEVLEEKFDRILERINFKKTEQKLKKLRKYILEEISVQLLDEFSILQKKKWIFKLMDE